MKKPILVIMAAGMGSRYGGLKQVDPIGPHGETIMDYSIYDAKRAGFETVVFIIKEEFAEEFKTKIGDAVSEHLEVRYAFQDVNNIPEGYEIPAGRVKPWGTAHAVLSAKDVIDSSFAVINADDFYGQQAFQEIYDFLANTENSTDNKLNLTMVAFLLKNTVSDNGYVSRGLCKTDEDGYLSEIIERTRIETHDGGIHYTVDDGASWVDVSPETIVSMNMWGFTEEILDYAEKFFVDFFNEEVPNNPEKAEFYLPSIVDKLLSSGEARVKVLSSPEKWYGVTYQEDKEEVISAIRRLINDGKYPEELWT